MKTKFIKSINPKLVLLSLLFGIIFSWLIKDGITPLILAGKSFINRSFFIQIAILILLVVCISVFFFLILSVSFYAGNKTGWGIILLIFLSTQLVIYSMNQPQISSGNGRGDDGVSYGRVAELFLEGQSPETSGPFVYRIGVPWLAHQITRLAGTLVDNSFRAINTFSVVSLIMLIYYLALRDCSPWYAALAAALYSIPFYSSTRQLFFYPVRVDPLWVFLMIAGLAIMTRKRITTISFLALCLITFLATLIRETSIILPLSFLLSRYSVRRLVSLEMLLGYPVTRTSRENETDNLRDLLMGFAMFSLFVGGFLFTHLVSIDTADYTFQNAILTAIYQNGLWHLVVSFCLAYGGPLIALLVLEKHIVARYFQQYPEFLIFVVLILILSYIGGGNTVRFMAWASPIVLILICACLESIMAKIHKMATKPKIILSTITTLCLVYSIIMVHPFDGYFSDYTAWAKWGGIQSSDINSLTNILPNFLPCIVLMLFMVILWRWIGPQGEENGLHFDP